MFSIRGCQAVTSGSQPMFFMGGAPEGGPCHPSAALVATKGKICGLVTASPNGQARSISCIATAPNRVRLSCPLLFTVEKSKKKEKSGRGASLPPRRKSQPSLLFFSIPPFFVTHHPKGIKEKEHPKRAKVKETAPFSPLPSIGLWSLESGILYSMEKSSSLNHPSSS